MMFVKLREFYRRDLLNFRRHRGGEEQTLLREISIQYFFDAISNARPVGLRADMQRYVKCLAGIPSLAADLPRLQLNIRQ